MNRNLEKEIISYCAPTLAGMKCGSLFRYYCKKEQGIKDIRDVNYKLNVKGIYIVPLKWEEEAVLIYVFRCRMLIEMLDGPVSDGSGPCAGRLGAGCSPCRLRGR